MRVTALDTKVSVQPLLLLWLAASFLLLPASWIAAWCVAVSIHEAWHLAAIRLLGGNIYAIRIGLTGAQIDTEPLTYMKNIICALSGPLGSLSLLMLGRWIPKVAICGFLHCIFNLLPVYPLDGGRALRSLLLLFLKKKTVGTVEGVVCVFTSVLLLLIGAYLSFFLQMGILPIFAAGITVIKNIKIPCKRWPQRVQ